MRKTVLLVLTPSPAVWGLPRRQATGSLGRGRRSAPAAAGRRPFVTVGGRPVHARRQPYYFVGTNFWQGMNLGVDGPSGDRPRLDAELDRLRELGVTNLRVMASSEGPNTEPYRMVPALMTSPGVYDRSVLDGLDYLLAEMGKRGMRAVMVLNNYWQWSGGMAQYVSWHEKTPIPYPGDYGMFMTYSAKFYTCHECQALVPRPHRDAGQPHQPLYRRRNTATTRPSSRGSWPTSRAATRRLDRRHRRLHQVARPQPHGHHRLGRHAARRADPGFRQDAQHVPDIDYATIHIWPQNWGWYDPKRPVDLRSRRAAGHRLLPKHAKEATALGKPLVLEEFGLARDWEPLQDNLDPASPTTNRDRFYTALYKLVWIRSVRRPGDGR